MRNGGGWPSPHWQAWLVLMIHLLQSPFIGKNVIGFNWKWWTKRKVVDMKWIWSQLFFTMYPSQTAKMVLKKTLLSTWYLKRKISWKGEICKSFPGWWVSQTNRPNNFVSKWPELAPKKEWIQKTVKRCVLEGWFCWLGQEAGWLGHTELSSYKFQNISIHIKWFKLKSTSIWMNDSKSPLAHCLNPKPSENGRFLAGC